MRAVWQFFEAEAEGDSLHLFAPEGPSRLHTFRFPRQRVGDYLCLSDYVLPAQGGQRDHLALFVVTAGEGVRDRAREGEERRVLLQDRMGCRHWRLRRRRVARNGCTGGFAKIGDFLIRRR